MGGSGVWAPLKGKIGGYDREEVGLQFVDIDLKALEVSRALLVSTIADVPGWAGVVQDQGRRRPSLGRCQEAEVIPMHPSATSRTDEFCLGRAKGQTGRWTYLLLAKNHFSS